jgi:hypothetical protein
MIKGMRQRIGAGILAGLTLAAVGCDSLLEVSDPDVAIFDDIDPIRDQAVLSQSAYQNFVSVLGSLIVYGAWFTNEARVGDTFPTRNEFGLRTIDYRSNGTLNDELWAPLSLAVATSEEVLELLKDAPDVGSNVNVARAALTAGYSVLYMAEMFCEGTIRVGPVLNTNQMLDHAISRFQQAISTGDATGNATGKAMADAARVGLARAYLMKGEKENAAAAADAVPADFEYAVAYFDDPAERARLGNDVYNFTVARLSLVVGDEWRAIANNNPQDKRIAYQDAGRNAQDGVLRFYRQNKYTSWAQPIRLASKLEARYIHAEATGDVAEQRALINERRAANGLTPFAGTDAELFNELMYQKALDFWLEGQRMGDWRRVGAAVPFVPAAGSTYYKGGTIGTQTCWPVPDEETLNNPNWPK